LSKPVETGAKGWTIFIEMASAAVFKAITTVYQNNKFPSLKMSKFFSHSQLEWTIKSYCDNGGANSIKFNNLTNAWSTG